MESASLVLAQIAPVDERLGQQPEVVRVLIAHPLRDVETVRDQVLAADGVGRLHQTVQQIAAGFVVVVGQIGVHLQWRGQIRDIAGDKEHREVAPSRLVVGGLLERDVISFPLVYSLAPSQPHGENCSSTSPDSNRSAPQRTGSGRYHSRRYACVSASRKLRSISHRSSYTDRWCGAPSSHSTSRARPPSITRTVATRTRSTSNDSQFSTRLDDPRWKQPEHWQLSRSQTAGNSNRSADDDSTVSTTRELCASKEAAVISGDDVEPPEAARSSRTDSSDFGRGRRLRDEPELPKVRRFVAVPRSVSPQLRYKRSTQVS
uniref:Uncharacterized protein n=1 Tax=Anopheles atroparvus TaxID=41427 RepID=A0A182JHM5_ANOAO